MIKVFAFIGIMHILLPVLGMLDVLDYHLCIKGPGECGTHAPK